LDYHITRRGLSTAPVDDPAGNDCLCMRMCVCVCVCMCVCVCVCVCVCMCLSSACLTHYHRDTIMP
jgi:hypothetical protein